MRVFVLLIILLITPSWVMAGGNTTNDSFNKAKKVLLKKVYVDHRETFYCGCPFDMKKDVIPSDQYTPKRNNKRAKRIEWEHVVPAEAFSLLLRVAH